MNRHTSRGRETATPVAHGRDGRSGSLGGRRAEYGGRAERSEHDGHGEPEGERTDSDEHGGREESGVSRRRGHDPVPGEVDVDGAPMAVDRCRFCGIVVLDSGRPGGPCPGPNRTLDEFGIVPSADREGQGHRANNGRSAGIDEKVDHRTAVEHGDENRWTRRKGENVQALVSR